ncbi:MAG: serine/threonine-protein kinase [Oscillospiraceae bacterium]|nr:serine/threonine-protein kinase [Oscillospiraceae bacterium]
MSEQDRAFPALSDPTYQIQSVLGSGGGGVVYKAWHSRLQKPVVLKQIKGEGKFDPRVQRIEVDILKNLRHSYLPQIYDFITEHDYDGSIREIYTVMEFIPGHSLEDLLKEGRRFPQQQVIHWARQLCSALVYLHGQTPPVLHSDIKPANIMLTENGDICLIDFNVSLVLHEGAAQALGRSPGYASPEQYGGLAVSAVEQHVPLQPAEPYAPRPTATEPYLPFQPPSTQNGTELINREAYSNVPATSARNGTELIDAERRATASSGGVTEMLYGNEGEGYGQTERLSYDPSVVPLPVESWRGPDIRLDARSDIYSLGATLYHLLTGEKPAISTSNIKPLTGFGVKLSEGVVYVVEKCMRRDPAQRFQTAAQLSQAVDGIHTNDRRWKRQRLTQALTVTFLAILIAASGAIAALGFLRMGDEKASKYSELVFDISRVASQEGADGGGSERAYNEAVALFPEKVAAYHAWAKVLFDDGRYEDCAAFIRGFIALWASYDVLEEESGLLGDIYFILAECFFEKEDFANAAQYYNIALEYSKFNLDYTRGYAIALARLGRVEEAEDVLDELQNLQAGDDSIYLLRGEIAYAKTDDAEAVEWFRKALEIIDNSQTRQRVYLMSANAYKRLPDRIDEEIELLLDARREFPEQLIIAEQLADAYTRAARDGGPEARAYMEQAVALFEDVRGKGLVSMRILLNIGILYQELGDFPSARAAYTEMLTNYEGEYRAPLRLAYLALEEQSVIPNEKRNYAETYKWYLMARELYDARPGSAGDDVEMLMLGNLITELRDNGWLENKEEG